MSRVGNTFLLRCHEGSKRSYIAAELAGIFNALGTETALYTRKPEGVLRAYDVSSRGPRPCILPVQVCFISQHDVTGVLMDEMQKAGCSLYLGSSVTKIVKEDDGTHTLTLDGIHTHRKGKATESKLDAGAAQFVYPTCNEGPEENADYDKSDAFVRGGYDCVLYAIGRSPNTQTLGLEAAGIAANGAGAIEVDDVSIAYTPLSRPLYSVHVRGLQYHKTSNPNVYAVGDVIGKIDLTPVAIAAGIRVLLPSWCAAHAE